MNLFNRKIPLFCVSNILVSFMCTNVLGTTYRSNTEILEQNSTEVVETANETEPASRIGESNTGKKNTVENKNNSSTKKNIVKKKEVATSFKYTPAKYSEVTGNAVVEYAKKYLGLRYVSGGNSLTKGTDCSGFTKLIYREFGVSLSRSVKGQTGNGTYVRKSDLKKGDLVFYGNGNGVASHVGIYMGNGKVIHESNHRDGVKISTVNMMQYITARRVINSNAVKIVEKKIQDETAKNNVQELNENSVITNTTVNNNQNKLVDNNTTNDAKSTENVTNAVNKENKANNENTTIVKEETVIENKTTEIVENQ